MNALHRIGLGLLAAVAVGVASAGAEDAPPVPPTPAPILDVVSIRPFTLDESTVHVWRAERPEYTSGYLLVLKVDPAYVLPRQVAEPVLYVGRQTAERVNHGFESGHVVAIVPAVLDDPKHPQYLDLAKTPIWFGTPELPERVDARAIDRELRSARAADIRPRPQPRLETARERGGVALSARTKDDVIAAAADLVTRYAPDERALIDRLRAE